MAVEDFQHLDSGRLNALGSDEQDIAADLPVGSLANDGVQ
jgi:hypothetical protein